MQPTVHHSQHNILPMRTSIVFFLDFFRGPTNITTLARGFTGEVLRMCSGLHIPKTMFVLEEELIGYRGSVWISRFHSKEDLGQGTGSVRWFT